MDDYIIRERALSMAQADFHHFYREHVAPEHVLAVASMYECFLRGMWPEPNKAAD